MPARKPKAGDQFRYVGELPLGIDAGQLLPGTIVTIRNVAAGSGGRDGDDGPPEAILAAEEIGAHDGTEDAVVIEWRAPGTVVTEMREEPYQRAEVVVTPEGGIEVDESTGAPKTVMVDRKRSIPVFGYGEIDRSMSIGLQGRDFTDANGRPAHFPAFADLFELAEEG